MKLRLLLGALLIAVGGLILIFGGFSFTQERRVVDLGPLRVNAQERRHVPISPLAGYACVLGGAALLVLSNNGRRR